MTAPIKIPFTDTRGENLRISEQLVDGFRSVLNSGQYILGNEVQLFEKEFANYLGMPHCCAVGSGTSALEIAFNGLNLNPTDEVIIQANAYIACAFGALHSKAILKIIDCDMNGCFSPENLELAITENTKAVLVVHLYGDSCDMDRVASFCSSRGITLVEDCAQSLGSEYNGKKLGSFGDISCHSFYPTKNLGAIGDAGAIVYRTDSFDTLFRKIRNLGSIEKYIHSVKGTNSRMDSIQATILRFKLKSLDVHIDNKRKIAQYYTDNGLPHILNNNPNVKHSYHLYVLSVENREYVINCLKQSGIETIIHYPIPFYKSKAFSEFNSLTFPNCESLSERIISIPVYASLTHEQTEYIIREVMVSICSSKN